jgi:hypothetical protein
MCDELMDFVNASSQQQRYRLDKVFLDPEKLTATEFVLQPLAWQSIRYGHDEICKVPDDRRGIYAFAISHPSDVLPPYCYVLYIGIAGRDSNRSLRERYGDYLNRKKILKRERIASMIGRWESILRFFFAPVEQTVTSEDLKTLERQLNTALMPPFSINDADAETKKMLRAFP